MKMYRTNSVLKETCSDDDVDEFCWLRMCIHERGVKH